jgi:receptor-type tyrosine-protein phosphatase N
MLTATRPNKKYLITMFVLCGLVGAVIIAAVVLFFGRRHARFHDKISQWAAGPKDETEATGAYQDLCRQHMQTKLSEKVEPVRSVRRTESIPGGAPVETVRTTSTGSSTSSWTEEPVTSNMDISTGHLILSYMENHLQNKDRLQTEWDMLCAYDAEPCSIVAAIEPTNMRKNRYTDILPYEHCRLKLNPANNVSGSDYINASNIMDHDPRNPAYIATQGPLSHTVADFWQVRILEFSFIFNQLIIIS